MPALPFSTPTILISAIAIAAFLVYLPFFPVAVGRLRADKEVMETLSKPRAVFDKLPTYAKRATWAHQNAFESFSLFAAAALTAYVAGVDSALAGWSAIVYLIARTLYPLFYILNVTLLRSLMFAIGSTCIGTLFVLAVRSTV